MITLTLRRHGGSVVVSVPRKILALLELDAGASVRIVVERGRLVLEPVRHRPTQADVLAARAALERRLGLRLRDAGASAPSAIGVGRPGSDNAPPAAVAPRRRHS